MKSKVGTISFIVRKDKTNSLGKAPLMLSYSLLGERIRLSVERSFKKDLTIFPYLFDSKINRAVYFDRKSAKDLFQSIQLGVKFDYDSQFFSMEEVRDYNFKLDELISIVKKAENLVDIENESYSAKDVIEKVKALLKGDVKQVKVSKSVFIIDYIKSEIESSKSIANHNTIKNNTTMLNHLIAFEESNAIKTELKNVDRQYLQSFFNWLIDKGQINSTASTQITKLKSFINLAFRDGLDVNRTYKDFTVKSNQMEVIALTYDEFKAVRDLNLSKKKSYDLTVNGELKKVGHKTLEKVRDLFLFGCYTGMRFSDLLAIRKSNIKNGYISFRVTKTKQLIEIPLLDEARQIIDRYKTELKILPTMSNQKFNQYIKLVCELSGLTEEVEIVRYKGSKQVKEVFPKYKLISAHTSRKTYITVSLELGMSAEEVMQISGHTSYKSFKRYVHISRERAKKAMNNAWKK